MRFIIPLFKLSNKKRMKKQDLTSQFPPIKSTSKWLKYVLIGQLFLFIGLQNAFGTDYYQSQSGNWNDPTTWTTDTNWPQTANTGTYPQAGDNVHLANNGHIATITLTADAECANLYFDGSEPACIIAMGNYDLTVVGNWAVNWTSNVSISQGSGYLQVNGGITQFNTAKTIANFRVGSSSFSFVQTNSITLTVTSCYDFNCYQATTPTGIDASNASKYHATPCNPEISASTLSNFATTCPGSTVGPNSFKTKGIGLTTADVNIAALAGFSYSTTANGTYTNTLSIPQSGGKFSQTIYVKFTPTAVASYDGNIVIGGGGVYYNHSVAAVGSGSNNVSPTITSPTSTNIQSTSATLNANITITGCSSDVITERGFYYSATSGFADGMGTKVSETGAFGTGAFSLNLTGLSTSTTYYYKAFATNSNGTGYSAQGTFSNTPLTYYSKQTGDWTSRSTWTTTGVGGTVNSGTYPQGSDNVVICQPHNITINATGLSCNNLDMSAYGTRLILNNDFSIYGNLLLTSQSYISAGTYNLAIGGNFTNTPNEYYARIEYSSGNISIGGNITVAKGGIEPFYCTGTGWLTMSGVSKTFTTNNDIIIPKFKQPGNSFTKAGSGIITISTIFDQNWGPKEPTGVVISIPGNTINKPVKTFQSQTSGNWNNTATWQQSVNGGSWTSATTTPTSADGSVTILSGNTVTLAANETANNLTINGSLVASTYTLTGINVLTLGSTGTLAIGGTTNFPTGFSANVLASGSIVNYNRSTGGQTIYPVSAYSTLTLSNTSGTQTINNNISIATLTINSNASLSVNPGKQLTVTNTLNNSGSLNLLSDATGTATILTPTTIGGSGGTYKVQQYLNSARNWYVSSPVTGAKVPTGNTYYQYDETGSNTGFVAPASLYWVALTQGATLSSSAIGYIAQPSGTATVEFTGTALNNGTVSTPTLTRTTNATKLGFNLIGNPYPSYLNARTAVNNSANLEKTIWYRTQNTSNVYVFDTYNTSSGIGTNNNLVSLVIGTIPPMQAFWVRVSSGTATLSFNNTLRTHKTDTINPFKVQASKNAEQQIVRLQVSNGASTDETILMANPNAADGYDAYDSPKFTNSAIPEIYTVLNSEEIAINGMSSLPHNTEIPLGFSTNTAANFSIKATEIANLDSSIRIILKDNAQESDITNGNAYQFTSGVTNSSTRFSIIFKTTGTTTNIDNNNEAADLQIHINANHQITINYNGNIAEKATVSIQNIIGQTLTAKKLDKTITIDDTFKSGIYLLIINNGGKTTTLKTLIN